MATTNKDYFVTMTEIIADYDSVSEEEKAAVLEFCNKQIEILEKKMAKAREKAEKRQAEGDELRALVYNELTKDYKAGEEIADMLVARTGDDEITKSRVQARLNQLYKAGFAEKDIIRIGKRRLMGYKLAEPTDVAKASESVETA